MNNDIIILSSSTDFTKKYRNLLKKKNLNYPIFEATGDKTLEIGIKYIAQGTKVIITRGNNLAILRKNLNAVLIDVRYTYEDVYFSLEKAKQYSDKIAYFGFGLAHAVASKFKNISGEDFLLVKPDSVANIDEMVKKLSEQGIDVFIGGITVAKAAKKYGVKNIMIQVDEVSLEIALDDAIFSLNFELERKKNYETIKQILNSTAEGIIGIDQNSEITYINNRAKKLLTDKNNNLLIEQILNLSKLKDTVKYGHAAYNELLEIGNTSLVLSSRPIKIDDNIFGAVVTIQKSDYIQTAEKEIRKKLNAKGHIAKKTFDDIIGKSQILATSIKKD
ncbi:putative PAS/PAC sensor protein [Clostridium carboxidivorans P7]|uniref:Putative PAS/PAC sensor protein n=1 Tax=Clostridium carboxidivorans P7 TaxID=536227 RepID=C6Q0L1_9CLOT|nr:PrpR N-terminal domain-containing protein [Clostridium carboxidivorans]EET84981.1 putative PAS/PAC sensor protein [Clostridium carboxidivorans P7]EFG87671.1 propionate catabolism activator [Clostridium carboxidivorans P7]